MMKSGKLDTSFPNKAKGLCVLWVGSCVVCVWMCVFVFRMVWMDPWQPHTILYWNRGKWNPCFWVPGVIILLRVLVLKVCSDWRNMIMNEMAIQNDLGKATSVLVCLWWCCRWWWWWSFLLCSSCCTKKVCLIWDFSPFCISSSGPLGSYLPPPPSKTKCSVVAGEDPS